MIITAPASSANIGPGFDALGLAIDVNFSMCINEQPKGGAWEPGDEKHIAILAYRQAGGQSDLSRIWTQSLIPYARGMGFSGAARVAGAYAAYVQNGLEHSTARDHAFRLAGDLEGHDDNAAASTYGGFCVTRSGHVMRFDCEPKQQGLCFVLFIPELTSSTQKSRATLPKSYSAKETIESIGNVAMLTALLASNTFNDEVLTLVTNDVIHQPCRFGDSEPSKIAYEAFKETGSVAQWLSGAGSSVAALVPEEKLKEVIENIESLELDCTFTCKEVEVSQDGVRDSTSLSVV